MKPRTYGCLLGLLLFVLAVSIIVNVLQFSAGAVGGSSLTMGASSRPPLRERLEVPAESGAERGKIVKIDLDGVISSVAPEGLFGVAVSTVAGLRRQFEQAANDDDIKAVVLRVNSPGGEVTASDILHHELKKLAEKKPVVVYMDSIAASGGYYIACASQHIVASETTLTASIGVIIDTVNYADLFGKVGLASNTFVSGPFKDSLSGSRPMREDERAYVQGLVDQMYDRFLTVVSEGRKLGKTQLRNGVADGRVVTGRQALELGLVDQIGYIEDAYAKARELGGAEGAGVVTYRSATSFFEILAESSATGLKAEPIKVEVKGPWPAAMLQPGVPYYLSPLSVPGH
ncbi:MAG: signal peptide peptidase SppA [Verrucomicrobiales bacterium]|nr:signal peptide peptidase SppA [Verrucomicrobiales bacterium]